MAEYEASGVSRQSFCASRGLAVATLDFYRKHVRQLADRAVGAGGRRLVAVEVDGDSGAVREASVGSAVLTAVLRNGRRIEVGGAFDAGLLAELLAVLERV